MQVWRKKTRQRKASRWYAVTDTVTAAAMAVRTLDLDVCHSFSHDVFLCLDVELTFGEIVNWLFRLFVLAVLFVVLGFSTPFSFHVQLMIFSLAGLLLPCVIVTCSCHVLIT